MESFTLQTSQGQPDCSQQDLLVMLRRAKCWRKLRKLKRVDAEEETDTEVDGFRDDEDDGKTDDNLDSDSDDEEETRDVDECTNIGDIVWAKHGRAWYPATIVGLDVVPPQVLQHLGRNLDKKQIVKWRGNDPWVSQSVNHKDKEDE